MEVLRQDRAAICRQLRHRHQIGTEPIGRRAIGILIILQALTSGEFFLRVRTGFVCLEKNLQPTDGVCKYCQLHMSVRHDAEHARTERKTSRLRDGSLSQGHPGLCDTPVGPSKTLTVHGSPYAGRPWVARKLHDVTTDKRHTTDKVLKQTCFR